MEKGGRKRNAIYIKKKKKKNLGGSEKYFCLTNFKSDSFSVER